MKAYAFMYPLKEIARAFQVARSGYYAWIKKPPSKRTELDNSLKPRIRAIHEKSRKTYGSIRVQHELAMDGYIVGRDHIARLRKEMNCRCIQKQKYRTTTDSNHDLPIAPNLLNQHFNIASPGMVWGSDITCISTDEGWLYLAGIKDFGSCEIVGYSMSSRMTKDIVQLALANALKIRTPLSDCIHHSDRGSQYCSYEYRSDIEKAGFRVSMSRKGNCYDNAPMESFWGSLKQELVHNRRFATRIEAKAAIQEYIEIFYNRVRCHSTIGYMAPSIYAELFYQKRKSA
jgi:putative transposase